MEGWRVLNKLANLRIDQNKSGTTAFHAGKFFRFPAFFSDPTVNSLFSHAEAFSQFFGVIFRPLKERIPADLYIVYETQQVTPALVKLLAALAQ